MHSRAMDIIMPMLSGIDTATEIRRNNSTAKIIFLSSSSEFGVQSYTVQASNYLLKPLDKELFYKALDRLATELLEEPKTLICKSNGMIRKIPIKDIEYIEAQDKYSLIVINQKQPLKVLPSSFIPLIVGKKIVSIQVFATSSV